MRNQGLFSTLFINAIRSEAEIDDAGRSIELCVTRMDEPKPPKPITARRYPACRLVMPPQTMLDIFNQLQNFVNALVQQGVLKTTPPPQPESKKQH